MVIKADGTKWACQSCLKGHRVSGCSHTDRELTLVPKKGRPVTQCQHCRAERKKRSAHVSCECGETEKPHHPKEKCIHLREAEEQAKAGLSDDAAAEKTSAYLTAVAEEQGCCCHHGGNCTCAMLKKEVDKDGSVTPPHGPAVKPRLESTKSDGSITVFQNGHHKPCHRKNNLAHESGMPYKMPMSRSNSHIGVSAKARRSVDSLALDHNAALNPSTLAPQAAATFNAGRRMSKSEQPSPKMFAADGPCGGIADPKFASIDFGGLAQIQTNQSMPSMSTEAYPYIPLDPTSAVTDYTYDPWSAMPSAESLPMPNNNPFGVWPTVSDVNGMAQPALTAASSNTHSEIDEIPRMDDMNGFMMPSIQEDIDNLPLDPMQGTVSPQLNRRSLPMNFYTAMPSDEQWPVGFDGAESSPKTFNSAGTFTFDNGWEGSNLPPVTDLPSRPAAGRPASKSLGPGSGDAVIQQLFPDLDVSNSYFGAPDNTQAFVPNVNSRTTSADTAMDFGPMDEEYEEYDFAAQQWTNGSLNVTDDEFTASYDLNQDYSNPDFTGSWSQ
ncbi:hypothetical protein LTR56_010750 [Elasticomyces elasticus]|nr:hypothetical protein LTR56_010750 [Elasticomyces elasticus]KAK3667775.1 hypothetical protein LTR22_001220 [Elasticomyces elasticus]KAK4932232.1 hypothetical protein LTR49_001529 [Elasticomyces elasticus]